MVWVLIGGDFEKSLGNEDGALVNEVSDFIKVISQMSQPFHHEGQQPRRRGHIGLGLPASRNVSN